MLTSKKIELRRSEIRQSLAELAANDNPSEDEIRKMGELDIEYRSAETRYRASLIAEDDERREAGAELETRSDEEWSKIMDRFEMRQVALSLDEGLQLSGETAEIVTELRGQGGYRGIPVPWEALEIRAGEAIASGTPNPIRTAPIIDRLFADSVAMKMGGRMINVGVGEREIPVTTSSVASGWTTGELTDVPGPLVYATTDRPLAPDYNLGIQMKISRKTLKQSGSGLEQAVRRDMSGAISEALDAAVFQGSGASGEPTGLFAGASAWGITETTINAVADYAAFRSAAVRFMTANSATGPGSVRLLLRPEIFDSMDGTLISGTAVSEWDRLAGKFGNIVLSSNALAAPAGSPLESSALLTTTVGGVAPFFVGTWGAVDLVRGPFTDAASGALRLTAITTADITISRAVQSEVLLELQ